jgi:molybdate transport system substrate-binding protein
MRLGRGAVAVWLLGATMAASVCGAMAAEISVSAGGAVKSALSETVLQFERASGHKVKVEYAPMGVLVKQFEQGTVPDVVVLAAEIMADAERKGWAVPGMARALGSVGVGVAVREGTPLPDISTADAFKQSLLAAKSITYMDPAKGTSGKHFAEILQRLGIADAVKAKTTLGAEGYIIESVARGEIELGVQQITEILPVKGAKLVGPLPPSLQKVSVYAVAPTPKARDAAAVGAFLESLRTQAVRDIFASKGFAP